MEEVIRCEEEGAVRINEANERRGKDLWTTRERGKEGDESTGR